MSTLKTTNIAHPSSASNNIVLDSSGNATLATAKITTLADSAGSNTSTPAEIASGRAKAWVNFNGTGTVAIRASYNVSSITDDGTGSYTVNFTTALPDANYSAIAVCGVVTTGAGSGPTQMFARNTSGALTDVAPTTTAVALATLNFGGNFSDIARISIAIFR